MTQFRTRRLKLQTRFDEHGSVVVRGLLKPEEVEHWCRKAKNFKKYKLNDTQSPGSPARYMGLKKLQSDMLPIIEKHTNLKLYKTYNYFRLYKDGTYLKPHIDRAACEISVTINLGGDDWEFCIKDYSGNTHTTLLKPGDGMVYRGCDLSHWRPGLFNGDELVQAFIHYVDQDGCRAWAKDDKFFRNNNGEMVERVGKHTS